MADKPDNAVAPGAGHQGLRDLFSYPLMSAITERRTRRVARGTSITSGPISHTSTNAPAPLINIIARSASSIDNAHAVSFFMINDEGTWLIKHLRNREALALLSAFPPKWEDWTEQNWLAAAGAAKHRLYAERLDFPRRWPYYFIWNRQISNRPGTTILLPIVDMTRQMINVFLSLLSEEDGQRPLFIDDWSPFRPKSLLDW